MEMVGVLLSIRQSTVEAAGRLLIKLSNSRFSIPTTSVCKSVADSNQNNVVVMAGGTFTCTIGAQLIELVYVNQPIVNLRTFVIAFDVMNSKASESCDIDVYQLEPYTNLVLDRNVISSFITTAALTLTNYDIYLSFG